MPTDLLVAALSGGGLASIVAAIFQSIVSRRKLGAEATKIITDAAAGVVQSMQADLLRQRQESAAEVADHKDFVRRLIESYEEEAEEWRKVWEQHVAWDEGARKELAKFGVELPPAPALLPPRRFKHPTS